MNFEDFIRLAWQALRQNRRRSALSLLGVVIGVVAVVCLTAIGEGAVRYVSDEFTSLGVQIVRILPGKNETTGGMPHGIGGIPNDLTIQDAIQVERRIQSVRSAVPLTISTDTASHGERSRKVSIVGATADFKVLQQLDLASGSFLPPSDLDRGTAVAVLGYEVVRELFGATNPLGATIRIGGWRMRVIGTLAERGHQMGLQVDESIFVPAPTGMRMANRSSLNQIMLELHAQADLDRSIEEIRALLIDRHDEEDFTCIAQDSIIESLTSILTILTLSVAGIAAISLGVAGIGIMNVMLVSVSERTDEVGLMKAVGATQRQILLIFLLEAALLSLAGGVIGLGVGTVLVWIGNGLYPAVPAATPYWAIASVLALSLGTGIVFGVLPAWRAAVLDPVTALRGS
jgi:putative ABC transport system permease protein